MDKRIGVVALSLLLVILVAALSSGFVPPMFVATAKNLRGALYLGYGPSPQHATEQALVKCSQDSVIPRTCKVLFVRADCPPAPPLPCNIPMKVKPPAKTKYHASNAGYRAVPYGPYGAAQAAPYGPPPRY